MTGPQAGKLQATEPRAEARLAIDRLPLQLQSSCPPPPTLADSYHPLDAAAAAGASQNETRFLCVFSRQQTAAVRSAIQIRCGLTQQIERTSPAPILRWVPPASLLKTFRAEGSWRLACGLRPATAKTASTLDFLHCAATAGNARHHTCASKILSQFSDSHFCNM